MIEQANRLWTLFSRYRRSRSLGFTFKGQSRTPVPEKVVLNGEEVSLSFPDDGGYINDITNIWLDDEYGLETFNQPLQNIVDIGANVGIFSLWAWNHFPTAEIFCFEPNDRIIAHTRQNLSGTGAHIFNAAVGKESGTGVLVDEGPSRLASTKMVSSGDITFWSLDDVVEHAGGSIDLLKVDCEGGEWDLLTCQSMHAVQQIRMEYHLSEDQTLSDFRSLVDQAGFQITFLNQHVGHGIAWLKRL